jgi:hypothetical protein
MIKMTEHISCGGELILQKAGNNREYDIFYCNKCKRTVRVFLAPSYNEYVEAGYIKKV